MNAMIKFPQFQQPTPDEIKCTHCGVVLEKLKTSTNATWEKAVADFRESHIKVCSK